MLRKTSDLQFYNMLEQVAFGPSFLKRMKFLTKGTDDSIVNEDLPTNGFASSGTHPTRITSDPDTHKDFQSTNNSTGISVLDVVQQVLFTCSSMYGLC